MVWRCKPQQLPQQHERERGGSSEAHSLQAAPRATQEQHEQAASHALPEQQEKAASHALPEQQEKAASHALQEQQDEQEHEDHNAQRNQQTAADPHTTTQATARHKRKRNPDSLSGPPSTFQAQPGAAQSGSHGTRVRRSRLTAADTPAAAAAAAASTGRRGKRQVSSSGAGAAAVSSPPAKRGRPASAAGGKKASKPSRASSTSPYADVLHRTVVVPGSVFSVHVPGAAYVGRVTSVVPRSKVPAVMVRFQDDNSKYWFPVADVKKWMRGMSARAWEAHNPGVPRVQADERGRTAAAREEEEVEEEEEKKSAAVALQSLSFSVHSGIKDGAAGSHPAQSTGRQQARGACSSPAAREAVTS